MTQIDRQSQSQQKLLSVRSLLDRHMPPIWFKSESAQRDGSKNETKCKIKKQSLPRVIWIKAHARGWLKIWGSAQDLLYAKVILGWFLFNLSLVTCSELQVALACFLKSFQTTDILPLINVSGRIIFSFVSCHRKKLSLEKFEGLFTS